MVPDTVLDVTVITYHYHCLRVNVNGVSREWHQVHLLKGVLLKSDGGDAEWAEAKCSMRNVVASLLGTGTWTAKGGVTGTEMNFQTIIREKIDFIPTEGLFEISVSYKL